MQTDTPAIDITPTPVPQEPPTDIMPTAVPEEPQPARGVPRRPRGKIVRLAPSVREKINLLLDEGLTYADIIRRLETDAPGLTKNDICSWYKSGFQDWIKNQLWLEETR